MRSESIFAWRCLAPCLAGCLSLASSLAAAPVPFSSANVIGTDPSFVPTLLTTDLDGDGDQDIVASGAEAAGLVWYENPEIGSGSWVAHVINSFQFGAPSVIAGDLDGDGDVDLVTAPTLAPSVSVLIWENTAGDASAWSSAAIGSSASSAASIEIADIDGDQKLDILGALQDTGSVVWWKNPGTLDLYWVETLIDDGLDFATAVAGADLDGDGDSDVVAASHNSNEVFWWENTDGSGAGWVRRTVTSTFDKPAVLCLADLDRDGDVDIVGGSNSFDGTVYWENSAGDGSSWEEHNVGSYSDFFYDKGLSVVDLDADGRLDILAAPRLSRSLIWYEAPPDLATASSWEVHVIQNDIGSATSAAAADLDLDGDLEAISTFALPGNSSRVAFWDNISLHRTAEFPSQQPLVGTGPFHSVGDVDGDGDSDLVVPLGPTGAGWLENPGAVGLDWPFHLAESEALGFAAIGVDLDGDRDLDIALASTFTDEIIWTENTGGDGGQWFAHTIDANFPLAVFIHATDIDGDGFQDILATSTSDSEIAWWRNVDGDGLTWLRGSIDSTFEAPGTAITADLDRDGDLDVLAAGTGAGRIDWWENASGDGGTWVQRTIAVLNQASGLAVADIDRDGDLDVVGGSLNRPFLLPGPSVLAWWENTDSVGGAWAMHSITTDFSGARSISAVDLDADGDIDFVVGRPEFDGGVSWWERQEGAEPAWIERPIVEGSEDFVASVFDADSDGDLDIAQIGVVTSNILFNQGGHVGWSSENIAPTAGSAGALVGVTSITVSHLGRIADRGAIVSAVDLLLEKFPSSGVPLTTAEASTMIAALHLYRDTGDGLFDPASDALVLTVDSLSLSGGGVQTLPLPTDDPTLAILPETPQQFFVVMTFADGPFLVGGMRIIPQVATSHARDQDFEVPLIIQESGVASVSTMVLSADLGITVSDGRTTATPGESVIYTLVATNAGPSDIMEATIESSFPSTALCSWTCQATAGASCPTAGSGNLDESINLPVGGQTTFTAQCAIASHATGFLLTTGLVTATTSDPGGNPSVASDTDTALIPLGDLSIALSDSLDPLPEGEPAVYLATLSNLGPSDAHGVVMASLLPAGLTLANSAGCTEDPLGIPLCTVGDLAAGASLEITVTATVGPSPPALVTFVASVSSSDIDPIASNDQAEEETAIDVDPPGILSVTAIEQTADGVLDECEAASGRVTGMLARFDEAMFDPAGDSDPADVTHLENYRLIAAGPDLQLSTLDCGALQGDDFAIPLAGVTYQEVNQTATLEFSGILRDGQHRLLICGSTLSDTAGNPLAGSGTGVAGTDFSRRFRIDRGNLFANGHFDCGPDLDPWIRLSTDPGEIEHDPTKDHQGSSASGSAHFSNLTTSTDFLLLQCIAASGDEVYQFESSARVSVGAGIPLTARPLCEFFDAQGCSGASLGILAETIPLDDTAGNWIALVNSFESPSRTQSTLCAMAIQSPAQGQFDLHIDRLRLRAPFIFVDAFESGDTLSWSSTIPP